MSAQPSKKTGYVKTQTVIGFVCIAFVAGFFAGIALAIHKSTPLPGVQPAAEPHDHNGEDIRALQAELARNPQNVTAWIQLGNTYFDANKFVDAIAAYEKALELEPNNADVYSDLGVMYRRNNQPQRAIQAFDRAVTLNPKHETARFNKGIVLLHDLNDREAAIRSWQELVDVNPLAKAPNGKSVDEMIRQFQEPASPKTN